MKLRQSLETLCRERGITISRLARETGVPVQTLHGWTEGRKAANLTHLKKVTDYLRIPLYEFLYGERDPHTTPKEEILKEIFSGDVRLTVQRIERRGSS